MSWRLLHGDCRDLMDLEIVDGSVDSIVTDPPYELTSKRPGGRSGLVRLVTPAGGLVLDPFAGSGSTGKACVLEGFRWIGCELDPAYVAIARARIAAAEGEVLW